MPEFGWSSLFISFLLAAIGVLFTGSRLFLRSFNDEEFFTALAKIRLASLVGVSVAYFILVYLFLQDRFDVVAVYKFSEISLDPIYKISASWSGMEGSLLFWTLNLSLFANLGLARYATYRGYLYYFVSLIFLLFVTLFLANPFKYTEALDISDGLGMNPLLHNVYMLVHPIIIYAGLNSTVYLLTKQLKDGPKSYDLIESIGWILLTAGIALGGYWAYIELGWGGYWAWDPVENSSFIPWLAYTAYIHLYKHSSGSALLLITAAVTHFYSVIGTFITRSGIVLSVHTFANSDVAWYLQWYVWFSLVCVGVLLVRGLRLGGLLKTRLDRVMFLNWLNLTFFAISILWGVLYGPFAEIFFEEKIILGIPFFEKISTPYFVLNFVLMSVGLSLWFGVQILKLRLFMAIAGGFVVGLLAYLQNTYTLFEVSFLGLLSFNAIYLIQLLFFVGGLKKSVSVLIHL
ncbi:MAG: cytochrome c biogenesis protein CcsA, partial [Thermoplasmatales archaeon]